LDQVSEAVIVTDSEFHVLYINSIAEKITDWSTADAEGKHISQIVILVNEIRQNILDGVLKKAILQKTSTTSFLINKRENELFVELIVSALKENQYSPYYTFVFKDITEEKLKDLELKESERKYKGLFEQALEGIFIIDEKSNIVDANPAACKIYNISREQFLKLRIKDIFPHLSHQEIVDIWANFKEQGYMNGLYKYLVNYENYKYIDFKTKANFIPGYHLAVFRDVTETVQAERALKASEANLKAVFNNISQRIILLDTNGYIVAANETAQRFTKARLGVELRIGSHMNDYGSKEQNDRFDPFYDQVRSGNIVIEELNLGQGYWIEIQMIPILNEKNEVKRICLITSDISHRKKAQFVLEESEQKFRSLAENSPDLIYIIDLTENRIIYFNRKKILGHDSKDLEESDIWNEIVHPDDKMQVNIHWRNFLNSNSNKPDSVEYRIRRYDGNYEWAINRHSIIERLPDGSPNQILLNLTIITERKKAEDALRESEARLTALIENTTDIIWSIDKHLNITTFNSSFKVLVKLTFGKYVKVGDNLKDILPDDMQEDWTTGHIKALNGERFSKEFNALVNKKNLFYEISYNPIFSDEGSISGVSVFARDITQRKASEDAIIRTNFELDSFVYRASHDLRAPLRSVLGLSALVKTEDNFTQRTNFLELIDKSVNKLDTFIADLTNFSRNSRLEITIEKINFEAIIEDCIENLKYMEGADSIDVIKQLTIDEEFYSDNTRILIILQNLLSNSIKYKNPRAERSYVNIIIKTTLEEAEIIVQDNGKGIKDEYLDKIFNMFFRASQESYGSGLGLYITKQVIEKLNGRIEVSSVLGSGTTFSIKLPNLK